MPWHTHISLLAPINTLVSVTDMIYNGFGVFIQNKGMRLLLDALYFPPLWLCNRRGSGILSTAGSLHIHINAGKTWLYPQCTATYGVSPPHPFRQHKHTACAWVGGGERQRGRRDGEMERRRNRRDGADITACVKYDATRRNDSGVICISSSNSLFLCH